MFISGIGYLVAMALQALDVRTYSCAACFFYLGCVCLGLMLARARIRKVRAGVWRGGGRDVLSWGQECVCLELMLVRVRIREVGAGVGVWAGMWNVWA